MNSRLFGFLDLAVVFVVVIGFAGWQLRSWLKWRKTQSQDLKQDDKPE